MSGISNLPPKPEFDLLVRTGLLTQKGDVAGADGPHPDEDLLAAIDRFDQLTERRQRLWRKACEYDHKGKRHKQITEETFKFKEEIEQLEIKIAATPAKTIVGATAKISIAMASIHPTGEGVSKNGTQHRLSLAALADAKIMLGFGQ